MNYKELFIDKDDVLLIRKELVRVLGDLNEAVILNQLHYWIEINKKAKKNLHGGKYWVFNTYQTWKETDFDFWSTDTIRRTLTRLENKGIVLTANYNKLKIDKTKWYTIDYERLQELINKREEKQAANKENADCVQDMANCTDGNGSINKAIPENTTENINRDYNTENTDKYALEDKKQSSKGDIYASVPGETEVGTPKKQNRYIPQDYTEGQLIEHIKQPVCDYMAKEYGGMASEEMSDKLIDIIASFHREYEENFGKRHRVLSDKAYENIVDRYMNPPDEMTDDYSIETYEAMMQRYFEINYNQRGNYGGDITFGLSHFMSDKIRNNLYCQTCK